jgi:Zn-dependent protease with chaperone function
MQALLQKRFIARTLLWSSLAAAVLPTSAAVLAFIWYSGMNTAPMAGFGFAMAFWRWWWLPAFPTIGFVLALEWKQDLDERIKQAPDHGTKRSDLV